MVAGQVLDMEGAQTAHASRIADYHANRQAGRLAYPFIAAGLILELRQTLVSLKNREN